VRQKVWSICRSLILEWAIGCILPQLVEEVEFSFANEMPSCKDWAPINAFQTIMRIIAIVSGRVISGHELAHNPEWIELSVSFTTDVFKAAGKLKFFPSFLRPIVQHFLPEMKRIKRAYATSHRLVDPVLKVRSEAAQWPGYVKPNDFVQWIADRMASEGLGYDQANMQLSFGLASIHTTAMTAVQIVYELAARPNEYEMLREDITEALRGSEGGSIDKHALARMKKLDSFMKEVQRLHPLSHGMLSALKIPFVQFYSNHSNIVAWLRRITAPVTLSDVHFPTDTLVAIPARPRAINSTNWPNSTAFDALRFYRMRERSAADAHLHQFTSIPSDANMFPFGYGKHACPGRFFASQEIKVLLIYLILNYDLRVPSEGTRSHERPVDFEIGLAIVPDPKILIEFKERTNL